MLWIHQGLLLRILYKIGLLVVQIMDYYIDYCHVAEKGFLLERHKNKVTSSKWDLYFCKEHKVTEMLLNSNSNC